MKERWKEMLEYQQKVQAMTDLERAEALFEELCTNEGRVIINVIIDALAAARREGAEEMRERAARLCDREVPWLGIGEDIRALPLTPEEPT